MNSYTGKRIFATAIGGIGLLIAAVAIFIVLAITQQWDIWAWFSSTQAFLVYAIGALVLCYGIVGIVMYLAVWRHR